MVANHRAARRYATAIFAIAKESRTVDTVGQDLDGIAAVLRQDDAVRNFFLAPIIDRNEKMRILLETFEHRVGETTLHALLLLVQKRRESLLVEIVAEYHRMVLAERSLHPLVITSARELHGDELAAMSARLSQLYRKQFDVRQEIDPELIGGVRVLMGDRRLDGTVSGRLEDVASTLFSKS